LAWDTNVSENSPASIMWIKTRLYARALCVVAGIAPLLATAQETTRDRIEFAEPFSDIKPYTSADNPLLGSGNDASRADKSRSEKPRPFFPSSAGSDAGAAAVVLNGLTKGDPKRIAFTGVQLFSEAELRHALACDLKFQAAARPSAETSKLLEVVEKRLRDGYRHSGCPDAKVSASYDGQRDAIVASVEEGPQFRRGKIEVSGAEGIDEEALTAWLTTQQRPASWSILFDGVPLEVLAQGEPSPPVGQNPKPVTFWKAGEVVDFDRLDEAKLHEGIRLALFQLGYASTRFETELKRDNEAGLLTLQIKLPASPTQNTIDDIEVQGLKRDSRESLLKYLEVEAGTPLNAKKLHAIFDKLTDSCRYWTYGIVVDVRQPEGEDGGKTTLKLTLEEYPAAPALGEPLTPVQSIMKKCAAWINSHNSAFGSEDLVCTTEGIELGAGMQQAYFALAADGTVAMRAMLASTIGIQANHTIVAGPNGLQFYDWRSSDKFVGATPSIPQFEFRITCNHGDQGEQQIYLHMGYRLASIDDTSADSSKYFSFDAKPVAMLDVAGREGTKTKLERGVLSIKTDSFEVEIDEKTGAVRSVTSANFLRAGINTIAFRSEKGFVAKAVDEAREKSASFPNCYDDENRWGSLLTYCLRQAYRQPIIHKSPAKSRLCRAAETLLNSPPIRARMIQFAQSSTNETPDRQPFWIPGDFANGTTLQLYDAAFFYCPCIADEMFPRGSWPWMACREIAFGRFSHGAADDNPRDYVEKSSREIYRLLGSRDCGPVTALTMARLYQRIQGNTSPLVAYLRAIAASDLSEDAFRRDTRLLTEGDHGLAVLTRTIAEQCADLTDEDLNDLEELLPKEAIYALKSLVARRKAQPEEPPGDAIEAVLVECWNDGWDGLVTAELKALLPDVARAPNENAPISK
jgi:hypothetical protein